jgi:hypothetical protein
LQLTILVDDVLQATHVDLNYMFQLCGNMKIIMTNLSRDSFSKPLGSSSRGAQADLDATDLEDDDDDALEAQRGRHV